MGRHILIAGKRHAGKSTLIQRLLAEVTVPVYGFRTRSGERGEGGFHSIHIFPADGSSTARTEENHIGDCNGRERTVYPEVFDTLGVQYLDAKPDGILVMDELGFMEEPAREFCGRVLEALDGEIPVLAAVKISDLGRDFLDAVRNHPNADVYEVTEDNREALFEQLKPVVQGWNGSVRES